jgi:hypothetical protein
MSTTEDRIALWNAALSRLGGGVSEVSRDVSDAEDASANEQATRLAALIVAAQSAAEKLTDDMNGLTASNVTNDPAPHPTFGDCIAEVATPLETRTVRLYTRVTEQRSYVDLTCGSHIQELSFLAGEDMSTTVQDAITEAIVEVVVTACREIITASEG